jgi:hypothetical protein
LLAISDSRFQPGLIEQAKKAASCRRTSSWTRASRQHPERLEAIRRGMHGCSRSIRWARLHGEERDLLRALNWLKSKFKLSEVLELGKAALDAPGPEGMSALARMQLDQPQGLKEELYQRLLLAGLAATR